MSDVENDDNSSSILESWTDTGKKNKKFKVCEGQTDAERRNIRKKQRLLHKEIDEGGEDFELEKARDTNNEIFGNVRFIREAVLDGENVNLIANKAAQKVDQLIQVPRYDADRVVAKLVSQLRTSSGFDWKTLGMEAGVCFNAVPSNITFLNGPLQDGQTDVKVRQVARRRPRVEEEHVEERPEDVQGHTARGADQLSAVQQNINDVAHALRKKFDNAFRERRRKLEAHFGGRDQIPADVYKKFKKHPEVCYVELLFNPKSFTQTVENIFHYSFLVKNGQAHFKIRKHDVELCPGLVLRAGPVVRYEKANEDADGTAKSHPTPKQQAVVGLTMRDWRNLIETYGVTKSDVPHRTGSRYQRETDTKHASQHEYEQSDEEEE